jgi:S1-C subfamily serine protease
VIWKSRIILFAATAILATTSVSGQGVSVNRVDPSKPRDGFGFALELPISLSMGGGSTSAAASGYPRVTRVLADSPADSAGIRVGDVIVAYDSVDVVAGKVKLNPPAGTRVLVRFRRGEEIREVAITSVRLYSPPETQPPE